MRDKAKSGGNGHHQARADQTQIENIDFSPHERVRAALSSRPVVEGITIDPPGTHIIDDGLHIGRHGKGWLIRTSVADLPAIIPHGSRLEGVARAKMKEEFVRGSGIDRIWPVKFLDKYVSLSEGKRRPAVTFTIFLDEHLNVQKYKISRTAFESKGAHHDGSFRKYPDFDEQKQREWRALAQGLYLKRNRDLAVIFDRGIDAQGTVNEVFFGRYQGDMEDGRLMVHEVMRLTNQVATDFLRTKGAVVPYKDQSAHIIPTRVSPNFEYELACNQACHKLVQMITEQSLPYVHLNSPMRRYTDYLSLKILTQQLRGGPQDIASLQEVDTLKANFSKQAGSQQDFMLRPTWRRQWEQHQQEQERGHPLDFFRPLKPGLPDAVTEMKNLCKAHGWKRPLTTERVIKVQNALIHFAGMKLMLAEGGELQVWSVSHDQDHALRIAARRILQAVNGQGVNGQGAALATIPVVPKP